MNMINRYSASLDVSKRNQMITTLIKIGLIQFNETISLTSNYLIWFCFWSLPVSTVVLVSTCCSDAMTAFRGVGNSANVTLGDCEFSQSPTCSSAGSDPCWYHEEMSMMPMITSLNFWNNAPGSGLVKKFAIIKSVGQCTIMILWFFSLSLMKK